LESFLLTFAAVALAEFGDKTQLVVIYLAARFRKPGAVLAGLVVAATANAGLAAGGGALLDRLVPEGFIEWLVAVLFLSVGAWILSGRGQTDDDPTPAPSHGAFVTTLWLFFVMEMGDKTQLATVALAAGLPSQAWVFVGASMGLAAANVPALWLGHKFASRLSYTMLSRLSGFLFLAIGTGLMLHLMWPWPWS